MTILQMQKIAMAMRYTLSQELDGSKIRDCDLRLLIMKLQVLGLRPNNVKDVDGIQALTAIAQTIFPKSKSIESRSSARTRLQATPLISAEWRLILSLAQKATT